MKHLILPTLALCFLLGAIPRSVHAADIDTPARVWNVGQGGGAGMHATVQDALDAIAFDPTPPSTTNRAIILVWPGKYVTNAPLHLPDYTAIQGINKGVVQFQNDTTDLFTCGNHVWFENFLVEGGTNASTYAFNCGNANAVHIRNVDMLNNGGNARQKFARWSGATWVNLFIEHVVVDYLGTSGYAVLFENTSTTKRFADASINDVFFDAWHLTDFGGSFQVRGFEDVRFNRSTIRGVNTTDPTTGFFRHTGIRFEKHLSSSNLTEMLEVNQCKMYGGVPVYGTAGTHYSLANTDAPGSATGGTRNLYNSR